MFFGIVAALGRIVKVTPREAKVRLAVALGALDLSDVELSDSVSHGEAVTGAGTYSPGRSVPVLCCALPHFN